MNGQIAAIRACEGELEFILKNQCNDKNKLEYGGYYNPEFGVVSRQCGQQTIIPTVLYFEKKSKYYKDPVALKCADLMLEHIINNANDDGTLDYFACNFHSAPDTAFVVLNLVRAYRAIDAITQDEKKFKEKMQAVLINLGKGILSGGFHTPNHRWVISAALSLLNSVQPCDMYTKRINEFLAEGIDCNEDGEFTERSAGGYNEINNRALLILAQELNMPNLLHHVKRNLYLMLGFINDDYSIFTENSTRQDKGNTIYAEKYAYQYLLCGYLLKDENLRAIGVKFLNECIEKSRPFPYWPDYYNDTPEIFENLPSAADDKIFDVERLYKQSGILRLTNDGIKIWVVENQPTFMFVKYKKIDFYIKGGVNFFDSRHITVQNITDTKDGFEMTFDAAGRYYLPIENYSGEALWGDMRRELRSKTPEIELKIKVKITKTQRGFSLNIIAGGCEYSTVRFEIGMRPNVILRGENFTVPTNAGGSLIAKGGFVTINDGENTLKLGPSFADNDITKGLFGSIEPSKDRFNLFFNAQTCFEKTIVIETADREFV